jgi:RNA polymerase sigma-70 factor (ECF subfamily)
MDARADIRDLIAAAHRGAPDAIGRLFEAARGDLLEVAARELPAEVRAKVAPSDVVQETAIDMQRDFARFTGTTADELFAWLREILRYNLIDVTRRDRAAIRRETARDAARPTPDLVGNLPAMTRTPAGSAIRREEAATLASAMARLAPSDREVLEMRHWQGMTFVAMAPLLGRSEEAVRKMWYRAVARLRAELASLPAGREATRDSTSTVAPTTD